MRQNNTSFIVGVTGGVGSGKSTVSKILSKELPGFLIDADEISRKVSELPETKDRIRQEFGDGVFKGDELDRKKLGKIVFSDPAKRAILNGIIHPMVKKVFRERTVEHGDNEYIIYDCPLLIEADLQHDVDLTLLVYVDEDLQLERVMTRDGLGKKDALDRINSQMKLEDKIPLSDIVVYNDSDLEDLKERVKAAADEIRSAKARL
ncbi:MAG: dephospho-CoA kinase [Eubacteriales bacterium]|nr:dephospho-CoA kinase [Eubacteriales bacterium]